MKFIVLVALAFLTSFAAQADYMDRARAYQDAQWNAYFARERDINRRTREKVLAEIQSLGGTLTREEPWSDGAPRYFFFSVKGYECSSNIDAISCFDGDNQPFDAKRTKKGWAFVPRKRRAL